jgi:uncharacterized membrane protein
MVEEGRRDMTHEPVNETSTEDEPGPSDWLASAQRTLRRPLPAIAFVVAAGLTIFYLGTRIGAAAGGAFDGDGVAMAVFFIVFIAVVVGVVALGVTLDRRRQRAADTED